MHIIAGLYRQQRLATPKGSQTRPTANRLRQALFNICQHKIIGTHFLDIFAGSGAMGFEALSRGAQTATFIDSHKEAYRCIESNASQLKIHNQVQIFKGEAFVMLNLLEKKKQTFDIIYADPPYNTKVPGEDFPYSTAIINWIDKHQLLNAGGLLFVEEDYRSAPLPGNLTTLIFKDSRRFGQASLQQYQKVLIQSAAT